MITGTINGRFEAVIKLTLFDSDGESHEFDAILDTGFTGSLTLPPSIIEALGLRWRSRSSAVLANGESLAFDLFIATLMWDGSPRKILVQSIENVPLLGMAMLEEHDLTARVVVGGVVRIEKVP